MQDMRFLMSIHDVVDIKINIQYSNSYDRLGRVSTIADGTGTRSFSYDATTLALAEEHLPDI
jgi:hypothetical protein